MSLGGYLAGILALVAVGAAITFTAHRVRRWLLPDWSASPALLVDAVLALSVATVLAQLLGLFDLLSRWPLILAAGGLAAAAHRFVPARDDSRQARGRSVVGPAETVASAIVVALSLAVFAEGTLRHLDEGMWGFDTLWYHMPLAAGFAQSGTASLHQLDPVSLNWFYPANSELLHGAALALVDRDFASPLFNLGWLGLTLLAGWCVGRPYGVPHLSLVAVALVAVSPTLTARQPGEAGNDVAALALLLSTAAILLNAFGGPRSPRPRDDGAVPLYPAGFAAGLALGTKLNLLAPAAALSAGVVAAALRGSRRRVAAVWLIAVAATGGFWYIRNLFAAGNPLPWLGADLGPISLPEPTTVGRIRPDFSVAHYLFDGDVWDGYFLPGLEVAFGELWPLVLGLAAVGIAAAIAGPGLMRRAVGLAALAGAVAYVFTPLSAGGPDGDPVIFAINLRWLAPFVALGLALLTTQVSARSLVARWVGFVSIAAVFTVNVAQGTSLEGEYAGEALLLGALAALAALTALALARSRAGRLDRALYAAAGAALAIGFFWPQARDYVDGRYEGVWRGQNVSESFLWAEGISDARIGVAGSTAAFFQYGYYGDDASNRVEYVAERGAHGSLLAIETCEEWRTTVNAGGYDYLVTAPTANPLDFAQPGFAPEGGWTRPDPAVREILREGPVSVFSVDGPLNPARCAQLEDPYTGVPPMLLQR